MLRSTSFWLRSSLPTFSARGDPPQFFVGDVEIGHVALLVRRSGVPGSSKLVSAVGRRRWVPPPHVDSACSAIRQRRVAPARRGPSRRSTHGPARTPRGTPAGWRCAGWCRPPLRRAGAVKPVRVVLISASSGYEEPHVLVSGLGEHEVLRPLDRFWNSSTRAASAGPLRKSASCSTITAMRSFPSGRRRVP